MLGVVLGFAMGYVAFTERGHEIGNQIGDAAISATKKVMGRGVEHHYGAENKPTEQSAGASGDDRPPR